VVCFVVSLACIQGGGGQVHRRARVSLHRGDWFLDRDWNVNRDLNTFDTTNGVFTVLGFCWGLRAILCTADL
jgi:hypothetical protein